ncbi:putative hydrolase of alpha/beta superfamily [Caulobacter sp. AP07]|uniref:alpha/beta hydrolase n=1 Tax=Caulobacter sp. AP07 TaxID=1144304 RepID=UPI0002720BAA|nr:alpha/beta hydrolase-fold protein [Caulobacter sp. AP07]EJL36989.1 putative hydrolase of alpha/beta superfamily [Caulobacter sp. AP07]
MYRRRFLTAMGAATAAAALVPTLAHAVTPDGTFMVASRVLGGERRINVALPKGYAGSNRRFPVLYLLDGGVKDEDFPKITDFVAALIAEGKLAPMIVVGIEGVDRKHDLTHPATFADDLKLLPQSGGSAAYRRFLVDELRPWVKARYRTDGKSGLIGESLAGLFVVETFLREPQAFDAYLAASPSLWWDDQSLSRQAADLLKAGNFKGRRLYLSIGNEGTTMQEGVDRVVAALKAAPPKGLTWRYEPMPAQQHSTIYDPSAKAGLPWLFPPH